ncbi:MAG: gamma-glutamyl-gamma-aminobutyrate hydrolase family protein, partial [Actinobacteria bacterium]|nr:gamma-glutamyl-gamma-aminobutyrate hydrolase family protein [Actinomycetota bacterium]
MDRVPRRGEPVRTAALPPDALSAPAALATLDVVTTPPVLVVQNDPTDPIARLGQWLVEAGLELAVVDRTGVPATLDGYAGLIVLGGSMGATDDAVAPWLPQVRALLRAAVRAELPTLGVCLGGQLLAAAHGGRIGANPDGPEFGAQLVAQGSPVGGGAHRGERRQRRVRVGGTAQCGDDDRRAVVHRLVRLGVPP